MARFAIFSSTAQEAMPGVRGWLREDPTAQQEPLDHEKIRTNIVWEKIEIWTWHNQGNLEWHEHEGIIMFVLENELLWGIKGFSIFMMSKDRVEVLESQLKKTNLRSSRAQEEADQKQQEQEKQIRAQKYREQDCF